MELRDQIQQSLGDPDFAAAWQSVSDVEGWMSEGQAALLWSSAAALRPLATVVEIGSYRARSMTILATAAPDGVRLTAIDPHAGNDRGPQQWEGSAEDGQSDNEVFWTNLDKAGLSDRVELVREFSFDAHDRVSGKIDLLYVDGAHGYRPALADLQDWGDRVNNGGLMLVHDCYSSVGVTLALLRHMFASSQWTYLGRTRSMGAWRRTPPSSRPANLASQAKELGWFTKNLLIKAAIAAKVGWLAKPLGSDGKSWPY